MSENNNSTEITSASPADQESNQTTGTSFLRLFQKKADKRKEAVAIAPSTKVTTTKATKLASVFSEHKRKTSPSIKADTTTKPNIDKDQPSAKPDNTDTKSSRQKVLNSLSSIFGDKNEAAKPKLAPANTNKNSIETKQKITKTARNIANDTNDQDTKYQLESQEQEPQATTKQKTKNQKARPVKHQESTAITKSPNKIAFFKQSYLAAHNYYIKTKALTLLFIAFAVSLPTLIILLAPIVAVFIIGLQAFSPSLQQALDISAAFNFITDPRAITAFSNSLIIAAVVGILAPISVMLMSFAGLYNKPFGLLFNTISSVGLIAPNIAFAVMCLSIIHLLDLTPSLFSLIIVHYFYALPIAAIAIDQGRKHLTSDIINTAEDLYATPWMIIGRIAFPVLKPSLSKAFYLCASLSISDVLIGHLVSGEKPLTLGAFVFYLWEVGNNKQLSFGILIMFIIGLGLAMLGLLSSKLKEDNPPVGETREGKRAGNIKDEVTLGQRNPSSETA